MQALVTTDGEQPSHTDYSAHIASLDAKSLENALFFPESLASVDNGEQPLPDVVPPKDEGSVERGAEGKDDPSEPSLRRLAMRGIAMSDRKMMADAASMIREGGAADLREAFTKMGLIPPAKASSDDDHASNGNETEDRQPVDHPTLASEEISKVLKDLREQREAAHLEFDTAETNRLTNLIEDQIGLLSEARFRESLHEEADKNSASSYRSSYLQSVDAVESKYAWATDETSKLFQRLDDKIVAARARNSPELHDPSFIIQYADAVAAEYASVPANQRLPIAAKPTPAARAPMGSNIAPSGQPHVMSDAELLKIINSSSAEALAASLW
jgi:hypothetical protein